MIDLMLFIHDETLQKQPAVPEVLEIPEAEPEPQPEPPADPQPQPQQQPQQEPVPPVEPQPQEPAPTEFSLVAEILKVCARAVDAKHRAGGT